MLARNETIFKWALYAGAAFVCLLIQWAVLQRFTVWGVIPFLYPAVAVVPAIFEGPAAGSAFALGVGVVCDLILPGSDCFYTLVFPLAGLCAGLLSRGVLRSGGDTLMCLFIDTSGVWFIGIPLAFIGGLVLKQPIYVVYGMVLLEEVYKAIIGYWRYRQKKWLRNLAV